MKGILIFCLCLPLIYQGGSEAYRLAERELVGWIERTPVPLDLAKRPEASISKYKYLKNLQRFANLHINAETTADPDNAQLKVLAAALKDHRRKVDDWTKNLQFLANDFDSVNESALSPSCCDFFKKLKHMARSVSDLKTVLASTEPDDTEVGRKIEKCKEELEKLRDDENVKTKQFYEIKGLLAGCKRVIAVKKLSPTYFLDLDNIVAEEFSRPAQPFANRQATNQIKEYLLRQKFVPYDRIVLIRSRTKADKSVEWKPVDLDASQNSVKVGGVSVKENPEVQFKEEPVYIVTGDLTRGYEKADAGEDGFKNRIRPTEKSLAAHAYNSALIQMRGASRLRNLESILANEFTTLGQTFKYYDKPKDAKFVISQLVSHHPKDNQGADIDWALFQAVLEAPRTCRNLFPNEK